LIRSIDVVLNRNARRLLGRDDLRDSLARAADRGGARLHETRDLGDLERAALDIAGRGTEAVILAGGDGSCMAGVSALTRAFGEGALPAIAFAPAGTVGTIARNIEGRRISPETVVQGVCDGVARTVRWPTLRIDDDAARKQVGFIFGGGLVQRLFEIYDVSARGVGAAAGIAARAFAGSLVGSKFARKMLEPVAFTVAIDGRTQPAPSYSLLVASVVRDVGLGLRLTYRAAEEQGRFHVVGSALPAESLGPQMMRVLAGRPLRGEPRIDVLAASLRVDFTGEDGAYVLDGDLFRARWATVVAGPVLTLLAAP
jgi:diacylglycerol kinase family enzyme